MLSKALPEATLPRASGAFRHNMYARLPRLEQKGSHNQEVVAILRRAVVGNT